VGKFVPGVVGIFGATDLGDSVEVDIGSGDYNFGLIANKPSSICSKAMEGEELLLLCPKNITAIKYATCGSSVQGECGSFSVGSCSAGSSVAVVERLCVGKQKCSILVNANLFGSRFICNEYENERSLVVEALCA